MNLGFNGKSARALFARLPARHVTKHVLTSTSRTSFQTYSVFASFNSYISMTCSFSHFRHSYFCLIFINIRKISENSSVLVRDDRISAFGWMCTWDDAPGMMHRARCIIPGASSQVHIHPNALIRSSLTKTDEFSEIFRMLMKIKQK